MSTDQSGYIPVPPQPQGTPATPVPQPPAAVPAPPAPAPAPAAAQAFPPQPGAYQPQPGVYQPQPGQYPGVPVMVPPPQPSLLTDPRALVAKLPLVALVTLIGFGVYGLYCLISGIVDAAGTYGRAESAVNGIFALVLYCMEGLVYFAILMTLKHFADLKQAKLDAAAAAAAAK